MDNNLRQQIYVQLDRVVNLDVIINNLNISRRNMYDYVVFY